MKIRNSYLLFFISSFLFKMIYTVSNEVKNMALTEYQIQNQAETKVNLQTENNNSNTNTNTNNSKATAVLKSTNRNKEKLSTQFLTASKAKAEAKTKTESELKIQIKAAAKSFNNAKAEKMLTEASNTNVSANTLKSANKAQTTAAAASESKTTTENNKKLKTEKNENANTHKYTNSMETILFSTIKEESNANIVAEGRAFKNQVKILKANEIHEELADWLMISSDAFVNMNIYPAISIPGEPKKVVINVDSENFRINDAFKKSDENKIENNPPGTNCFWFRLYGHNLYYSSTKSDINILGAVTVHKVVGLINLEQDHAGYHCFVIRDETKQEWKICSKEEQKRNKWVCKLQEKLKLRLESFCQGSSPDKKETNTLEIKKVLVTY